MGTVKKDKKDIVFCCKCRYYNGHDCISHNNIRGYDTIRGRVEYSNWPEFINKAGDCGWFEPRLLRRIFNFAKGLISEKI